MLLREGAAGAGAASCSDACAEIFQAGCRGSAALASSLFTDTLFSMLSLMRSDPLLLKLPDSLRIAKSRSLSLFRFAVAEIGTCSALLDSCTFPAKVFDLAPGGYQFTVSSVTAGYFSAERVPLN